MIWFCYNGPQDYCSFPNLYFTLYSTNLLKYTKVSWFTFSPNLPQWILGKGTGHVDLGVPAGYPAEALCCCTWTQQTECSGVLSIQSGGSRLSLTLEGCLPSANGRESGLENELLLKIPREKKKKQWQDTAVEPRGWGQSPNRMEHRSRPSLGHAHSPFLPPATLIWRGQPSCHPSSVPAGSVPFLSPSTPR